MLAHRKMLFENYSKVREELWQGKSETDLQNYQRFMAEIYRRYYKKYLGENKKLKILEIGCSTGGMLQVMYKDGFRHLTGIDMCEANIEIAKKRNRNIRYFAGDGVEFLKNVSEEFDIICSRAVFEHLEKNIVLETICEMKKHCSKGGGGGVLIDVPNMDWIWASHERYMDFTHECGFTKESLTEVLKPYFKKIQISYEDTFLHVNMKNKMARYILWKLYRNGGIGVSYEKMWSDSIVAFATDAD